MLITFTSKVYPDVVMFGDVATRLLQAMDLRALGHRAEPPGILRGEEIRLAAGKLRAFLEVAPKDSTAADEYKDKQDDERKEQLRNRVGVGLRTRALPLLDMMDASYKEDADFIWR